VTGLTLPLWLVVVLLLVVLPPLFVAGCALGAWLGTALADWQFEREQPSNGRAR
jgi:hypothetical protein